jgi:hypothetical protein
VPSRGATKRRKLTRPKLDSALETRKRHALMLVGQGRLDGELGLCLTG